jgi:hypothetical protein
MRPEGMTGHGTLVKSGRFDPTRPLRLRLGTGQSLKALEAVDWMVSDNEPYAARAYDDRCDRKVRIRDASDRGCSRSMLD